jgi:hypothetical protein
MSFYAGKTYYLIVSRHCRRSVVTGEKMKRAVAIIVVLLCILLVTNTSAKVEITCSVYPEEADFKSGFVYSITLTNKGFITTGELSLKVGSDSDNRSINGEWNVTEMVLEPESSCVIENKKIRIPEGKSCTVKKVVDFTDPELNQRAFRDWTENPKSPVWDKVWYECCFTPHPYGDEVCCEGSGEPILTHCIEEFGEHNVEQNEKYKDLSFDYYIKVWANCKDRIELQVRNYSNTSSSGWDKHFGLKNYTERDVYTNKTLTWHAVTLTPDNFDSEWRGHYKFVGYINKSQLYMGPTIEERFDDPKVSYNKTVNELSFDYEITAWVNIINDSIELEIYNNSSKEWEQKGIRNYTKPGYNQTLRWAGIKLSYDDHFDDHLNGKYRFTGTYGESSPIDEGHQGPTIEENYYNLEVTPKEGTNTDTFNYSVTVNATVCDKIELQVRNHTSDKWDSKGTRAYRTPDKNETLTWQEIRLNSHELDRFNDTLYKFVGIANSSESKGPFYPIDLRWRNHSVTPNVGFYNDSFAYSIELYSTREIEVKLRVYYPPEGKSEISGPTKKYTDRGNWEPLCWKDTQPFKYEDEGIAAYIFEFYSKGTRINETELYSGPIIGIAEFKDASFEPEIGTRETEFSYKIWVKAVKLDYITLRVYDSKGDNVAEGISKDKTTAEWKLFEFENVPFKAPPASGIARYEFITGKNTKVSFDGPELILEDFGALIAAPENGTNSTPFNFSIDFSTSKPRNVTLWARYDDGEWEEVETKPVTSKRETVSFSNITPRKEFKSIEWKCTGIVSESEITRTNWDIGLKWQNRSFSPKEGWWNDKFNFSVRLSANVPGDVVLMAKEEGTSAWKAIDKKPYTSSPNPQTLTWENARICNNAYEGSTSYNFSFYWGKTGYAATPSYGPRLFIPPDISIPSADVIPGECVSYIENKMLKDYFKNPNVPVNFSCSVSAAKDTNIKLVTIDPFSKAETEYETEKRYYAPELKTLKWSIESSNFGRLGIWNYKFMYKDTRYGWTNYRGVFNGPKLIAVLRDFDIVPEPPLLYGESCDVTVVVNGSRDLRITLALCNSTSHCEPVQNGTKLYKSNGGEQKMIWKDIKPFGETYGSNDKLLFDLDVTWEGENE